MLGGEKTKKDIKWKVFVMCSHLILKTFILFGVFLGLHMGRIDGFFLLT